jgi:hypothetical protein
LHMYAINMKNHVWNETDNVGKENFVPGWQNSWSLLSYVTNF